MAENKQYITHVQDNGSIHISEEVISAIVLHVIKDVEGVVSLGAKHTADNLVLKTLGKNLKIVISEENEVTIDCNLVVAYGYTVMNVASAVQDAISSAVESMTGVKPAAVNVNVSGIVRK